MFGAASGLNAFARATKVFVRDKSCQRKYSPASSLDLSFSKNANILSYGAERPSKLITYSSPAGNDAGLVTAKLADAAVVTGILFDS